MQQELRHLQAALWKPHYNEKQYQGSWTTLQLRSINGSLENNIAIQATSLQHNMAYLDTSLLNESPYFQSVLNFFQCEKMSVRLMKLNAGAVIKDHMDLDMNFEAGETRFHIPVQTNEAVNFFIEDELIPMKEGECWYLNLSLNHRVNNWGTTDRIHLVIDCKVNDWVKNLLHENALIKKETHTKSEATQYSNAEKILIVKQLRLMGTAVASELADKIENGSN
ncbi:MAG: aspartyl/asparaginyl beta-hydroxylase domain-containing protein [Ferruginibacter sp.]